MALNDLKMTTVSFSHYYFLHNILSSKRSYCDRPFCDRQEMGKRQSLSISLQIKSDIVIM